MTRLFVVTGCHTCPNLVSERTPGAGYALDYFCKASRDKQGKLRGVDGYVEWESEKRKPGDFPNFCPLEARYNLEKAEPL